MAGCIRHRYTVFNVHVSLLRTRSNVKLEGMAESDWELMEPGLEVRPFSRSALMDAEKTTGSR